MRQLLACLLVLTLAVHLSLLRVAKCQALMNQYVMGLHGANLVAAPGDPTGGGIANITVDFSSGSFWFSFLIMTSSEPQTATINYGGPTGSGPAVVDLLSSRVSVSLAGEYAYRIQGVVPGDPALMAAIVATPGSYYVVVTSILYPSGALRSQLEYGDSGTRISYTDSDISAWSR